MKFRSFLQQLRRTVKAVLGYDVGHRRDLALPAVHLGSSRGGWTVFTEPLTPESVVYTFGVGSDISFDLDLIARTGATVHAFDPTPKSIAWVNEQQLPPQFEFHPIGVSDFDGVATFHGPEDPSHDSFSLAQDHGSEAEEVRADVRRLSSIMDSLRHEHIDLLKMDIEGAEYGVISDLVTSSIDVRQILVEFHHRFPAIGVEQTNSAVEQLQKHGYTLYNVSPRGEEYSFIRSDQIDAPVKSPQL